MQFAGTVIVRQVAMIDARMPLQQCRMETLAAEKQIAAFPAPTLQRYCGNRKRAREQMASELHLFDRPCCKTTCRARLCGRTASTGGEIPLQTGIFFDITAETI